MDRRMSADLDRYITGNYGEDQLRDHECELPEKASPGEHFICTECGDEYEYRSSPIATGGTYEAWMPVEAAI